jgi:hypothetical protein
VTATPGFCSLTSVRDHSVTKAVVSQVNLGSASDMGASKVARGRHSRDGGACGLRESTKGARKARPRGATRHGAGVCHDSTAVRCLSGPW